MFAGLPNSEKDPRLSLHVEDVATPELAPDECFVAVMASAINFNTVWTSIFEPLPTFGFLERLGRESAWGKRHDLPYHVVGSDAAGVVVRVGSAVRNWHPGDKVVVHCNYVDAQDPDAHDDAMLASNQRIWGFETQLRRSGRPGARPGEPAHAQARASQLGGSRRQRPLQLDLVPHARQPKRCPDETRRRRPRMGGDRRPRGLCRAVRAERRRYPRRRRRRRLPR